MNLKNVLIVLLVLISFSSLVKSSTIINTQINLNNFTTPCWGNVNYNCSDSDFQLLAYWNATNYYATYLQSSSSFTHYLLMVNGTQYNPVVSPPSYSQSINAILQGSKIYLVCYYQYNADIYVGIFDTNTLTSNEANKLFYLFRLSRYEKFKKNSFILWL
jgi:hypothetical protein